MSVPIGAVQATFAATLVDEWIRGGVSHAVVCPGSRSTPLALALARRHEITIHVRLDERASAFYALGLAKAGAGPVVICTTSGTAAAELHAGVVEASHSGTPMIVCTADRPPSMHRVSAPQTIEQTGLFASASRWSFEPGVARLEEATTWRSIAAQALLEARGAPGPVHLNLAFVEPLVAEPVELPAGRLGGVPWHGTLTGPALPSSQPETGLAAVERGVLIAGAGAPPPQVVLEVARALGWPVLADPRSGCRLADDVVVGAVDSLVRDPVVRSVLAPQVVVTLGEPWVSRVLGDFVTEVAKSGTPVVALSTGWPDPSRVTNEIVHGDAAAWLQALCGRAPGAGRSAWLARWTAAECAAQRAISRSLADGTAASEPSVLRHLFATLDPETMLLVAASMPMRDLENFGAPRPNPPLVLANRGANGIDGLCSTALGAAAAGRGPVVAVLGDLAFLHDVSAFASVDDEIGDCTVVVLDNGGGGIFSFLSQAQSVPGPEFERLFGTAPRVSVSEVARGFGLDVADISSLGELDDVLAVRERGRRRVLRVGVPSRPENVELHSRIHEAVALEVKAELDL
jgi:2-succinyl-5-enolpyruvyl-6-hydroxy-3-cyclohexene-1-carboxylate synthase